MYTVRTVHGKAGYDDKDDSIKSRHSSDMHILKRGRHSVCISCHFIYEQSLGAVYGVQNKADIFGVQRC